MGHLRIGYDNNTYAPLVTIDQIQMPFHAVGRSFPYELLVLFITSARGHELSGRVRAHAYNYYAWAECAWVAK